MLALAQQLAALNATLCGGGTGGRLIGTPPVLAQLDAAWATMGALCGLADALQLERNDLIRVAQAGSLLFGAGQQSLAVRLAAVRSLDAGRDACPDLEECTEKQLNAAREMVDHLVSSQEHDPQLMQAMAFLMGPPRQLAAWLGCLSEALQTSAAMLHQGESFLLARCRVRPAGEPLLLVCPAHGTVHVAGACQRPAVCSRSSVAVHCTQAGRPAAVFPPSPVVLLPAHPTHLQAY